MDSLTHIVLGAAIGDIVLRKHIGRKGALVGALLKSIPDFDLFYTGLKDPFMYVCHHRGHTHSLIWESLYAIPIAIIFYYLFKRKVSFTRWIMVSLICLWGHSLLDVCTNYGTRIFLPLTDHAYSWNNMAIADIFFTLPMLIMLIVGLCYKNESTKRSRWITSIFIYCFLYLGYTFINKSQANTIFESSLKSNKIDYYQYMTNPTILNNFLWYGIAQNDSTLYIGEKSLLFPSRDIQWLSYPRNHSLLVNYPDTKRADVLNWFGQGYDISEKNNDTLNVYCVKFGRTNMMETGLKSSFVFHYKLFNAVGRDTMTMEEPNDNSAPIKEGIKDIYERIMGRR
jgi:inner membrane protein